ncbi:hypothetical protein AB07_2474 [Citrobacter freundii]|uniref:Uncharacterized protein n=1 Tax=Citrobacter freundii TaxID=546 RepID=A0A7G2IRG4_CITFR|nr:hypothetical protein AB07_2474 [Citrobacter freundii]CDL39570.1 hypothetical protein [Citrobacter freundii]
MTHHHFFKMKHKSRVPARLIGEWLKPEPCSDMIESIRV